MGRKTHSANTRNMKPKSLIGQAIENTLSNTARYMPIAAQPPVTTSSKVIGHMNDCIDDPNIFRATSSVEAFCSLLEDVVRRFESNCDIVHNADLEICDLLHEAELLPSLSAKDGYKFYNKVRTARLKRRTAKTENAILAPVYNFVKTNGIAVNDIRKLKDQCAKSNLDVLNAHYVYRIQEDPYVVDM